MRATQGCKINPALNAQSKTAVSAPKIMGPATRARVETGKRNR